MSKNKIILIVVASLLLLFALLASLTEYREISTNEWKEKYNYNDEQPQGLFIFKELTNRFFKDVPTTLNGYPEDTINVNSLYIQFVPEYLEQEEVDTLMKIAAAGNDVLIIADYFLEYIADSIPLYFNDFSVEDSILSFNFTNQDLASDTNFLYEFHDRDFMQSEKINFHLMQGQYVEGDNDFVKVDTPTPNGLALMVAIPIGKGRLFYHVKKDLFYNYSFRQPQMFDYAQKVLSHFDPQHVYLLSPITIYESNSADDRNPLDFIMSQPALKAAYYLLILGTFLYVVFGGKRKQKIIPVTQKNENTSLQYIDTVSQLFYQQGQHEKLVTHMRNIFHHKMQKKFFVTPDDPNYVAMLAKKSKVSQTELQYIMDRFKNLDDNFSFRGDQLVSLNRRLEKIYKEIATK